MQKLHRTSLTSDQHKNGWVLRFVRFNEALLIDSSNSLDELTPRKLPPKLSNKKVVNNIPPRDIIQNGLQIGPVDVPGTVLLELLRSSVIKVFEN